VIARQLCDNAGFDATNILNKLRQKHAQDGGVWYGVDILNEDIADNFLACVWEPAIVKSNAIVAASEATCLLLRWSFFWDSWQHIGRSHCFGSEYGNFSYISI
jgi:T-complex protein 1 subunit eta